MQTLFLHKVHEKYPDFLISSYIDQKKLIKITFYIQIK